MLMMVAIDRSCSSKQTESEKKDCLDDCRMECSSLASLGLSSSNSIFLYKLTFLKLKSYLFLSKWSNY